MRITSFKLSVLALLVVGALALVPAASATTCPMGDTCFELTQSNIGAGDFGQVQISGNTVTIVMNSGFAILTNGGQIGLNGTGISTSTSLSGFSVSGMTADLKTSHGGTVLQTNGGGGFNYNAIFSTNSGGGQDFVTTLTFTVNNATSITGLGLHICFDFQNGTCVGSTGFVTTGGVTQTPEPGTLGLLGTGLVGIAGLIRRRFVS